VEVAPGPLEKVQAPATSLLQTAQRTRAANRNKQKLILGTAVTSFHNVTIWVYEKAMRLLGYEVQVISQYPHEKLYPMFTGHEGIAGGCKTEGCEELCEENGLGLTSPCVDFVVDSNIPINHAKWLEDYTNLFSSVGTAFSTFYISLFTPEYSKFRTLTEAAKAPNVSKTIIGFKTGVENDCASFYCPVCGTGELDYITEPPLGNAGFTYTAYRCDEFSEEMNKRLAKKEEFIALMWMPSAWLFKFPTMRQIDLQNYTYQIKPNSGKALIRNAARYKFSPKAQSLLQAIYVGQDSVQDMDGWAHGWGSEGALCPYLSFNNVCAEEAAQKWINENQNNLTTGEHGVWPMFFW